MNKTINLYIFRELTSITNPNRAKAAGNLAVAHEIEMARRAGLWDVKNEEKSHKQHVQDTEVEEKNVKNTLSSTSESSPR